MRSDGTDNYLFEMIICYVCNIGGELVENNIYMQNNISGAADQICHLRSVCCCQLHGISEPTTLLTFFPALKTDENIAYHFMNESRSSQSITALNHSVVLLSKYKTHRKLDRSPTVNLVGCNS